MTFILRRANLLDMIVAGMLVEQPTLRGMVELVLVFIQQNEGLLQIVIIAIVASHRDMTTQSIADDTSGNMARGTKRLPHAVVG